MRTIRLKESQFQKLIKRIIKEGDGNVTYEQLKNCYKTHTNVSGFQNGFTPVMECRTNPNSEDCKLGIQNHLKKLSGYPEKKKNFESCLKSIYGGKLIIEGDPGDGERDDFSEYEGRTDLYADDDISDDF